MSLAPIESKIKRVSEMKTGGHLVIIADILYLKNSKKEPILNDKGELTLLVVFKNDKNERHEQHYTVDEGKQIELFKKMLISAGVPMPEDGSSPSKKDAIGKRLWIFIREVHHVEDNEVIKDFQGNPIIEYYIFKTVQYMDEMAKPKVPGDPEDNEGVASGLFIDYKNFSLGKKQEVEKPETTQPNPPEEASEPSFIEPISNMRATEAVKDSLIQDAMTKTPEAINRVKENLEKTMNAIKKEIDWNSEPKF